MKEILVLDDYIDVIKLFERTINVLNKLDLENILSLTTYNLASKSIKTIQEREKSFDAYFVDMRIPKEEDLSEVVFYEVNKKFDVSNFYFMTGHISGHDEGVLERTQAKCFKKPFYIIDVLTSIAKNQEIDKNLLYKY